MSITSTRQYLSSSLSAYSTKGKAPAFSVSGKQQIYCYNVRSYNNSGSAINMGLLQKFVAGQYNLFQYTNTGPVYTNVSAQINAGTSTNIFSGTNNDGFVVQGQYPFGMIGLTIGTNQANGTFTYKYYNGSTFTTLTTLEVPANYNSAGDVWIVFQPPNDWAVGGATGLNSSQYSILVQSTTAPAGAVGATAIWVARFLEFYESVPNNAAIQLSFPDSKPLLLEGGCGLIPYFSTANAANQIAVFYALA